jgi:hypothetical protein
MYKTDGNKVFKEVTTLVEVPLKDISQELAFEFVNKDLWTLETFAEWMTTQRSENLQFTEGELIVVRCGNEWLTREFVEFTEQGFVRCKVPTSNDTCVWTQFRKL